ncbi:hypothetical protein LAZ40_04470 [Cereibacter sphaeroides]|uniref:hypothetical protein n=1 Tax=Cereibacter sphaeroides TaxID=1063 RepID=UPI001F2D6214|nr:hypothetical protein [Cereibacter sphaeroides]MCE6958310.1 hypothetical protein [Cereibacter sphaeroides]MCE6971920.1 hypothetical protein [Cereibacter sphaeroides]
MAKRSEKHSEAARQVEEALRREGRHFEADAIGRLRRSLSAALGTMGVLHRDNMELRQRLGLPSLLDLPAADGDHAA